MCSSWKMFSSLISSTSSDMITSTSVFVQPEQGQGLAFKGIIQAVAAQADSHRHANRVGYVNDSGKPGVFPGIQGGMMAGYCLHEVGREVPLVGHPGANSGVRESQHFLFRHRKRLLLLMHPPDDLVVGLGHIDTQDHLADIVQQPGDKGLVGDRISDAPGNGAGSHGTGHGMPPDVARGDLVALHFPF